MRRSNDGTGDSKWTNWSPMKRRLKQRQVQVGVLVVLLTLSLAVLSFLLLDIAKFKDELGVAQSIITSLAILVGGVFAILKFQLFRDFEPHLSISQMVSHRFVGSRYVHVAVTSLLNNNSRVRLDLNSGFVRVQQIAPTTDADVVDLYAQVFLRNEQEDLQWPTLDEFQRTSTREHLIIEPGESHQETCEFIISVDVQSVLVHTYFYNSRHSPGSQSAQGWGATTFHDIIGNRPVQ